MPRILACLVGFICGATGIVGAQAPYIGRWVQNLDRSDFEPFIVAYEVAAGGFKITQDGSTYSIAIDGREYPTPSGGTVAWLKLNERTWQIVNRRDGKHTSTDTMRLSQDGRGMVREAHAVMPSGRRSIDKTTFQRVSAGRGVAGQWKAVKVTTTAPETLEFLSPAHGAITLRNVDLNLSCRAKLDGKDYPSEGPMQPAGFTCAVSESGERSLDVLIKKDGKVTVHIRFTVSADGATLTESIVGGRGPRTVFERR
jgi:hypothetical protein